MANNLTQVQEVHIADKFLESFVAALTPLRAFSTDFSPEFSERGNAMVEDAVNALGRADGLVNNAIAGRQNVSFDEARWDD